MSTRNKDGRYAVTGPGLDGVFAPEIGPGISRAITAAQCKSAPQDGTWYVRDLDGTPVAHVENVDGVTFIRRGKVAA